MSLSGTPGYLLTFSRNNEGGWCGGQGVGAATGELSPRLHCDEADAIHCLYHHRHCCWLFVYFYSPVQTKTVFVLNIIIFTIKCFHFYYKKDVIAQQQLLLAIPALYFCCVLLLFVHAE